MVWVLGDGGVCGDGSLWSVSVYSSPWERVMEVYFCVGGVVEVVVGGIIIICLRVIRPM